jgi:solute:Na+ symporter, SSS family
VNWLDYLVIAAYLGAISVLGSSFYRRRATTKEYFLGSRGFGWLPAGISIVAANTSAISLMGDSAWAFHHDFEFFWLSVGYVLMAPVVIRVFIPFYASLDLYTAYEYLEKRFGLSVRLVASGLFQLLRGVHIAIAIYAPSLIINVVTGLPLWECVIFMGLLTTAYTTLGGMKAVIWTDVIQFSAVCIGILAVLIVALHRIPGGLSAAYHIAAAAGRLRLFNFSTNPNVLTSFWACLIGGCILSLAPLTTDQSVLQRLFTTKSAKDSEQSVWLNAWIGVPMEVGLLWIGALLWVYYHQHPGQLAGLKNGDTILAFFSVRELPTGLAGLLIASLFGASMGVMSAGINALSTATTIDFYARVFRPDRSDKHYANVGRIFTACWGLAGTTMALFAGHLGALALSFPHILSFVSGPILGIFLLGMLSRRTSSVGVLTGAAAGAMVVVVVSSETSWSFFYMGPIGVAVSLGAGWLASQFTERPNPEQIKGLVVGEN